jgi:hypothetical protein
MQMDFRPDDRLDFMKKLHDSVEFVFSGHYRPTPEYFKPFHDALQLFIAKFTKVYDILQHGVRDNVLIMPRCDNKPGGLVHLFVNKIPYEYGIKVLQLLDKIKWDTLNSFIKEFRAVTDKHKEDGERARMLRRCFGGTQYEAKSFEKKLQHLQELRALPEGSSLQDSEWQDAVDTEQEDLEEELDSMLAAAMHQHPHGKEAPKKFSSDKNAPPRDPLVCITKLLHGTCTKSPCNYSHKEDLVTKKRYEFIDLIQKQITASKTAGAQRAHSHQKVAVLEDIYDDEGY